MSAIGSIGQVPAGGVGAAEQASSPERTQQLQKLRGVAREFEAIFVRQLLETTAQSSAVMGQEGEGLGQGAMMQQYHESMAKLMAGADAFGLASYLERHLAPEPVKAAGAIERAQAEVSQEITPESLYQESLGDP